MNSASSFPSDAAPGPVAEGEAAEDEGEEREERSKKEREGEAGGQGRPLVSRSQTVTLAVTVWTTAVERFVLGSPGSRVGDKCEQYRKEHDSHYLLAKVWRRVLHARCGLYM